MKKIIVIVLVIAAAAGFYFYSQKDNKFSEFDKNLLGQWQGEKDGAFRYFSSKHRMYVEAFGVVFSEIKWKISDATPGSNRMLVYFYDEKSTEEGKKFEEKWKAYKDPNAKPVKYPAAFTYTPGGKEGILKVYDEKGSEIETLSKISDRQEPATWNKGL